MPIIWWQRGGEPGLFCVKFEAWGLRGKDRQFMILVA